MSYIQRVPFKLPTLFMQLDLILKLLCPCSHPGPSEQRKQTEAAL